MHFLIIVTIVTKLLWPVSCEKYDPLSNEFIDHINSLQTSWKAGRNFPPDVPLSRIARLVGVRPGHRQHLPPQKLHQLGPNTAIPEQFDARERWPYCPTLNQVRDQGACSSCWALAAVEVMTDRVCILSNGSKNFHFSAEDLITCCRGCGSCNGGWPATAWKHWVSRGIVSGGDFNSKQGCLSYEVPPCEHSMTGSRPPCEGQGAIINPPCRKRCQPGYNISYKKDLNFGSSYYSVDSHIEQIQMELMTNGPVEATFIVFEDFLHYKSGVYTHVDGKMLGPHAVKLMGWGVEAGVPHWLVVNSWNTDWGQGGMFMIRRGNDECGIEDEIVAGLPKLSQY